MHFLSVFGPITPSPNQYNRVLECGIFNPKIDMRVADQKIMEMMGAIIHGRTYFLSSTK